MIPPTSPGAACYAPGTPPRPSPAPPTCSPGSATSSSPPDFPPYGQARPHPDKSPTTPGPATPSPHNSETRVLRTEKKKKGPAMTSQIPDQMPQPGPLEQAAPPASDGARRCKQPGCGAGLPAATGRGAPRVFCSPACSRKWHNDSRVSASPPAAAQQAAVAAGPLAGLHQLLTQAAGLVAGAAAQLAAADPGRVTATLAAADAARRQAQAETAVALAQAAGAVQAEQAATAAMHAARHDTQAALEAADQARADADGADARAQAARDHASAQITQIRQQADTALAVRCPE